MIHTGETDRELEKTQKTLLQRIPLYLVFYTIVCSLNTLYTSPWRTDRSTHCTSMLFMSRLHLVANIFLHEEYLSVGYSARVCVSHSGLRTSLRTRSGRCWACLSTVPLLFKWVPCEDTFLRFGIEFLSRGIGNMYLRDGAKNADMW